MKNDPPFGGGGPESAQRIEKQQNAPCVTSSAPSTAKSKFFPPELHSGVVRSKTGRRPVTLPRLRFLEDGGGA
jgi:hypothetical protein